jgi:hypothetical protein
MKNISIYKYFLAILIISTALSACFKDLNTAPLDPLEITSAVVYDDPANYKKVLAKLYAGLALSGQEGPAGQADISGIDEGFGQYLRGYWYHQELTTDEAVIGWADQTILDFHNQSWTPQDGFIYAFYSRIFYQISLCNEFIRETTNEKLDSRGVSGQLRSDIQGFRAEARFLRALSYWHALDLFRNVPFVTERDAVGAFFPQQTNAAALFSYIESELKSIENDIAPARSNQYARADRAAVWMLLAKLYLNADVYISQNRYEDCLRECEKILSAGYTLEPNYQHLFLADNHRSREIIFPIAFDGINTRTWGGMTFIINASIGGSMRAADLGMAGGWGGTRTTRQLVEKFPEDLSGIIKPFNPGATSSYPKVYVPGSYSGFNGTDTRNSLSSKNRNNVFEGYRYFSQDNTEFVILRNPSSTLSGRLGSNNQDGTLQTNGANIVAGPKGLYYIRVSLPAGNLTYQLERQEWFVVGSATGGEEIPLEWSDDLDFGIVKLERELSPGSFHFVGKGQQTIILGDNGADGLLEPNGAPIQVDGGGLRILLNLRQQDYTYQLALTSFDRRGIFYTQGQTLDINDITLFTQGFGVQKFKNISSNGNPGSNATFPDTDFPMFRLADAYLMAAEAIVRGAGGGDRSKAADYVNTVRQRAFGSIAGNLSPNDITLDFLIDERARELYWECHRRTDLIRFGKFSTSDYLWQWKGGIQQGRSVPEYRNVFPIPAPDLNANPNLRQNTGYN